MTALVLVQQRRIAEEKQVADSLRLAAQSASVLSQHRDVGTLLAVAAVHTDDNLQTRAAVVDAVGTRGGPLVYFPASLNARSVARSFTPGGSVVVGTERDVHTLSPIDGHDAGPTLIGHESDVVGVAVAGDLVVSGDADGLVLVHRVGIAGPITQTDRASSNITAVEVDPTGTIVLAATAFGPVERWQRAADRLIRLSPLTGSAGVIDLAISGDEVIGLTTGGALRRWRSADGVALPDLAVPGALGSGSTMRIAVVDRDHVVTIDGARIGVWDLRTGQAQFGDASGDQAVAVTPDGVTAFVGTAAGSVTAWRLTPGPLPVEPTRSGLGPAVAALATDGRFLVGMDQRGSLVSWDLTGRRSPAARPLAEADRPVTTVAEASDGAVASAGLDGVVRLTRVGVTSAVATFDVPVTRLWWSSAGLIVLGTAEGQVRSLDPVTGVQRLLLNRPNSAVVGIAGAGAGPLLAAFADGQVLTVDGPTTEVVATGPPATALAVSRDGRFLAVASSDGGSPPVITLHTATAPYAVLHVLRGHDLEIASLAFSPDGELLASGSDDRTIRLWSTRGGDAVATLTGHTDMVLALAFTANGGSLASGSQDGSLRLWDVGARQEIGQPLTFGPGDVAALSPSLDGTSLIAANGTSVVQWPFAVSTWITTACRLAQRDLTVEEWNRFLPGNTAEPPRCGPVP